MLREGDKMNILYVTSEATPFAASGGLADVAGSLPGAIVGHGHDCRVIMPLYGDIIAQWRNNMTLVAELSVDVAWRKQYVGIFTVIVNGVTYYLIDNEYYFKRSGLYGYYDDAERFAFFSRAVLEALRLIGFKPDIINCNDWQTALVPVYYNAIYRYQSGYEDIKTVFTIHNIAYQGRYGLELMSDVLGLPEFLTPLMEYDGDLNFMKAAIECSDKVTTVSPTYATEILDPWFAHGLDRILRQKQYKTCGFLNGIDTKSYNPDIDPIIPANYNVDNKKGKAICKEKLMEESGLEAGKEPLIGIITRFANHKGLDLIKAVFDDIVALGYKVVILGSGEAEYENFFREMQQRYPGRVSLTIGFIPALARKIYAGADMFLMPSMSEPCGLAQMISLRYGTIPIVRETGGLKDSIIDSGDKGGNGFTFQTYNAHDMLSAIKRAREYYDKRMLWGKLVSRALRSDFSWTKSAELYLGLYRELIGKNI